MRIMRSLKASLAATVCLLPLQVLAQTPGSLPGSTPLPAPGADPAGNNWITVGGQYQSDKSYYFGRYTGTKDRGGYFLGDMRVDWHDAWDSGGTRYFRADVTDLGLPSRSATVKAGQQGTWGVVFSYDGIPYYLTETYLTPWQSGGSLVPGIAPGSVSNTARVSNQLWNTPLDTQRDIFGAVGKYQWGQWTFTAGVRHDHKEGLQANSLAILAAPAATATTLAASGLGYFAQPIDWDMDRYDATLSYGTERVQAELGYTFSQFTDNAPVVNLANPFAFPAAAALGAAGSSPARVSSFYTAPPSNSAHELHLLLGYNITPTMRVNANFAYGINLQNDGFSSANGNTNPGE